MLYVGYRREYKIRDAMVAHGLQERSVINTQPSWDKVRDKYLNVPQDREQGRKSFVLVGRSQRGKGNKTERGRRVSSPDFPSYRLFFRKNGSIRKNVRWIQARQGLEGHSRAIYYYADKTSGWLTFPSRYSALSQHWTQNFKIKRSRKQNL